MSDRLVLSLVLNHACDKSLFKTCTLLNKWFHTFCRRKLNLIREKTQYVNGNLTYKFQFFDINYDDREMSLKTLSFIQLAKVMIDALERLGEGYSLRLSSSCESGFTLTTPDNRICEVRFSIMCGGIRVHTLENFSELDPFELLSEISKEEGTAAKNILRFENHYCGDPSRSCYFFVSLIPKFYSRPSNPRYKCGVTYFEYRVLCESFSKVTGTEMCQSNPSQTWTGQLPPFQEWLISNRLNVAQSMPNYQCMTDILDDDLFPKENPRDMLNYLQWIMSDFIESFVFLYGMYEEETQAAISVISLIKRCKACGRIIDLMEIDEDESDFVRFGLCGRLDCITDVSERYCN